MSKCSEETKRKISLAKKGKVVISEKQKKQISKKLKGRKLSKFTKEKMSKFRKGKPFPNIATTEQHKSILWRTSISKGLKKYFINNFGIKRTSIKEKLDRMSMNYREWRKQIFERDNWTCRNCEIRGGILHPHHIKGFFENPKLRFNINNGITFCINCHKLFHKIYGKRNNNMKQIISFKKGDLLISGVRK